MDGAVPAVGASAAAMDGAAPAINAGPGFHLAGSVLRFADHTV